MKLARLRSEGGFSAPVMVLLFAVMILLLGGVSVDLWRVLAEHRRVSGVADGAAISGATAIDTSLLYADPNAAPALAERAVVDRACSYAVRSGVVASCPGEDAMVVVSDDSVTVTLRRDVDVTLLSLLSLAGGDVSPIEVGAVATASLRRASP